MTKVSEERLKELLSGTAQNVTAKEIWVRNAAIEVERNKGSLEKFIDRTINIDMSKQSVKQLPKKEDFKKPPESKNTKILDTQKDNQGIGKEVTKNIDTYKTEAIIHLRDVQELIDEVTAGFSSSNLSVNLDSFFNAEKLHRAIQGHKTKTYKPSKPNNYYYHKYGKYKKEGDPWRYERKPKVIYNNEFSKFTSEFKEVDVSLVRKAAALGSRANELFETEILTTVRGLRHDSERGFVYVLNSSETNISKIGMTKNSAHQRLKDYVATHQLQGNWSVYAVFPTHFVSKVEREAHDKFSHLRISTDTGARELFRVSPDRAEIEIKKILSQYNKQSFVSRVTSVNGELRRMINERNLIRSELIKSLNSQILNYLSAKNAESRDFDVRHREYESKPLHQKIFTPKPIKKRGEVGATGDSIASEKTSNTLGCLLVGGWVPIVFCFTIFGNVGGVISILVLLAIIIWGM